MNILARDAPHLLPVEQDLLTDLFNAGAGQAAHSLSQLVGKEVALSIPNLEFLDRRELCTRVGPGNSVSCVTQPICGHFDAQSMLVFSEQGCLEIIRLMLGKRVPDEAVQELCEEAFTEIGNIVLNACIGSLADNMALNFEIGLPQFETASVERLVQSEARTREVILFVGMVLSLNGNDVSGCLALMLGKRSLKKFQAILREMH